MIPFNVFDLPLYQHRLIEASAGTGKTYSIENLCVRFLVEEHPSLGRPLQIEEILLVTFTRAATYDLRVRIRRNIASAIDVIKNGGDSPLACYLEAFADGSEKAVQRLEEALFVFDEAPIFTIHGFCSRALNEQLFESAMTLDGGDEEETMPTTELRLLVRDFFRSEVGGGDYSKGQLARVLNSHHGNVEELERAIAKLITRGCEITRSPSFSELLAAFSIAMTNLKSKEGMTTEAILADYSLRAPNYKKLRLTDDADIIVERFARLFEKESWIGGDLDLLIGDSLALTAMLADSNLKKKAAPPAAADLRLPQLVPLLKENLAPIIDQARSGDVLLARMAADCRELLFKRMDAEEKQTFECLLSNMAASIENPRFADKVRGRYYAAVIDEFQDTDPVQWKIFSSLFLSGGWPGALYIVGDPKQSIYGFRQADIYTYLAAGERLSGSSATLATNYRSQPEMLKALNILFSEEVSPGLIALPRIDSALPYHPINAGREDVRLLEADGRAAVHFFIAEVGECRANSFPLEEMEADGFFPFIIDEIRRLHNHGAGYRQIAVLVSDRYQGKRLSDVLQAAAIPSRQQRSATLASSPGRLYLRDLLHSLLYPRDYSSLKAALGGRLIGLDHQEIAVLEDSSQYEAILDRMASLRNLLHDRGFAAFFETFMNSCWNNATITEKILLEEGGGDLYSDLIQIADILIEEQASRRCSADALLLLLDNLEEMEINEDARIKKKNDPFEEAVNIITMHSSKGLEYDIVFALGVLKRSPAPSLIVPEAGAQRLKALLTSDDPAYLSHCRELDAEKVRQLYVAFTRARERLYIPTAIAPSSKTTVGRASPMELLLAHLNLPHGGSLYDKINGYDGTALRELIASAPCFSVTELGGALFNEPAAHDDKAPPLLEPKPVEIAVNKTFLHSFTSLSKKGEEERAHSTVRAPSDFSSSEKSPHTLPAGSATGNLLHTILELTPFESIDIEKIVAAAISDSAYQPWKNCLSAIVSDAFGADLGGFCLRDIQEANSYRETEFLYPCEGPLPSECEARGSGYIKGVIDLFFFHNGFYYLLDWKSNWLGSDGSCYIHEALEEAMTAHNYHLQAALYYEAARRYLKVVDKKPISAIFGGTYYLFLRGLEAGSNRGIYFIAPDKKEAAWKN